MIIFHISQEESKASLKAGKAHLAQYLEGSSFAINSILLMQPKVPLGSKEANGPGVGRLSFPSFSKVVFSFAFAPCCVCSAEKALSHCWCCIGVCLMSDCIKCQPWKSLEVRFVSGWGGWVVLPSLCFSCSLTVSGRGESISLYTCFGFMCIYFYLPFLRIQCRNIYMFMIPSLPPSPQFLCFPLSDSHLKFMSSSSVRLCSATIHC